MTPRTLLEALAPVLPAQVDLLFPGYLGCILTTRVALEVCRHFGVDAAPLPCQLIAYNSAFAVHVENQDPPDIERWHREDGSHSVGIGFGVDPEGGVRPPGWDGHLIVTAGGLFADYSLAQVERPEYGILIPSPPVGPYPKSGVWRVENETGTVVEYHATTDETYRAAPDWRDPRRLRLIARPVIRELQERLK